MNYKNKTQIKDESPKILRNFWPANKTSNEQLESNYHRIHRLDP